MGAINEKEVGRKKVRSYGQSLTTTNEKEKKEGRRKGGGTYLFDKLRLSKKEKKGSLFIQRGRSVGSARMKKRGGATLTLSLLGIHSGLLAEKRGSQ